MLICWYGRCSRDIQRLVLQFSIFEERKLKPSMAGLWAKTCCTSSIFGHRMSFEHLDTYLQPDPSGAQERLEEDLGWMLMQCLERENEKQRVGGQWPARQSPAVLRGQLLLKSSVISADSHLWQAVTGHLESMLETREDMNNKQISRSEWMHQANSSNNRTLLCPCWRHSLAVTCRLAEDILLDEQVPALRTTLAERLDNISGCIKKRVLRISDWFRPVPNFFSTTVVLFSIFSDISWYLWSQTSPLSKDSIFFTTLKVCIFQVTVLVQFLLQKGDMSWLTPVSFFLVFHRCGGDFCCFHFCVTEWCLKLLTPRTITCWDKRMVWGTLPLDTVFVCIRFL